MLKSINSLGIASAIVLAGAISASANVTVLDYSVQNGPGNNADVFAANYGAITPSGATWSEDPTVPVPPTTNVSTSQYKSPFVDTPLANTRSYFSTGGVIGTAGSVSPITLTFATLQSSISLLWGSIDSYNKISFFDMANSILGSYTGTQIIEAINDQKSASIATNQTNYEIVALLRFDFADFKSIVFSSEANGVGPNDQAAFEFAAPIPLPAAAWLLLAGVGGLFGYGRFRRRSSASTA